MKHNDLKGIKDLQNKKIHFIGVGGIGMSALAKYARELNLEASGSDKVHSNTLESLNKLKVRTWFPQNKTKIEEFNPDIVVYSTAINETNEEYSWAKLNKKELIHRSDFLALLTNEKFLISVSGTHGKTTTSSMITEALTASGFKPSSILGGILESQNSNVVFSSSNYFVIEGDESDKSFLKGDPSISVITNIEVDHLENYNNDEKEILKSFKYFAEKGFKESGLIVCTEDPQVTSLIEENFDVSSSKLITYGFKESTPTPKINASYNKEDESWSIFFNDSLLGTFKPKSFGKHNLLNSLAAVSVGHLLKADIKLLLKALEDFKGVKRRFQKIKDSKSLTIIDDYAHHPTEITATLKAAREMHKGRIVAIIQPHHPPRIQSLWNEYVNCFNEIKDPTIKIYITDIYVARKSEITDKSNKITSLNLVNQIENKNISYLKGNIETITNKVQPLIEPGDLVLTIGAGDITKVSHQLALSMGTNNVELLT